MKKTDQKKFKKILIEKRKLLVEDIRRMQGEWSDSNTREPGGNLSHMPIHMADISSDNYEQEITLGLIEAEEREIREIDAALKRIEEGDYGVCENCEKPIKAARLKAIPNARLCIKCKQLEEEDML